MQDCFAANDTNFCVINFDLVDDGTDASPPEGRVAGEDIRPHRLGECGDLFLCDPGAGAHLRDRTVEGDLRNIAFSLHRSDPLFEGRIGWIGDAVLDGSIEPPEASFGIGKLCAQSTQAYRMVLFRAASVRIKNAWSPSLRPKPRPFGDDPSRIKQGLRPLAVKGHDASARGVPRP